MIPQRSDVTQLVLSLLGDTQASGGSIYTATFQAPHLNSAYQELYGKLDNIGGDRVQREGYYLLPAYTGVLYPVVAGLSNFGSPIQVRERGTATSYAISAATPATGTCALTVAALPASVVTGAQAEVYGVGGISDDINDQWFLTVNSSTSVVLNGCNATGTYTSGGYLIYSTEEWSAPLIPQGSTDAFPRQASSVLGMYCSQRGVIKFPPATASRELRIKYQLSASLPVSAQAPTDALGIDDSLNFLAYRTAQLCAASKGNPREGKLTQQADYHLALMLQKNVREQQTGESVVPTSFRGRRNVRFGLM